jgi:histidinol-phosphatase
VGQRPQLRAHDEVCARGRRDRNLRRLLGAWCTGFRRIFAPRTVGRVPLTSGAVAYDGELALAMELADVADAVTMPRFGARNLTVEHKADHSEVSDADRRAEAALRERLAAARPHHAVLGEEDGLAGPPDSPWRWVVDPIDGTANYVRGIPIWATLVALLHHDRPVVGVVSAPVLGRRWWAAEGDGTRANGALVHVSTVASMADAHLAHGGIGTFYEQGYGEAVVTLTRAAWRSRGLGDFWMHCLVAEGAFDVSVEASVSLWDVAALVVVVTEAGGRFTDLAGRPGPHGSSALSTNGLLHDEVLAAFAPVNAP